jgi:hypothetical protein
MSNARWHEMTSVSSSDSSDVLRFGWALGIAALMATWITFSSVHRYQTADTLVPVLVSTLKWTPFYWGQDRFGMLIPLLAEPIRSPFVNLLFQTCLGACAALFAPFLVLRYVLGDGPTWLLSGAVVNLTALIVLPARIQCDWFLAEPYALSLTLAVSAFLLLEKSTTTRWASAILLMAFAHWINVSAFTLLAPLVILQYLMQKQQSDLNRVIPCIAIGATAGLIIMRASHYRGVTNLGVDPAQLWLNSWTQQVQAISKLETPHFLIFIVWVAPAASVVLFRLLRPDVETKSLAAAAVLGGAGAVNWLFVGTLVWVRLNLYFIRYTLPALLFCVCALVVLPVSFFEKWIGAKPVFVLSVLLTFGAIGYKYGLPSVAEVRNVMNQQFGRMTDDILSSKATLVAGNYWSVWPAVFQANLTLYERGEREAVYGLTDRSSVTTPFWFQMPKSKLCVAAARGDTQATMYMDLAGLRSLGREERKTISVFMFQDDSSCQRSFKLSH